MKHEAEYQAVKYYHENEGWNISWMCKVLNIGRSSYYKWLHREVPEREKENLLLAQLVREYDDRYGHILGYRRMTGWINRYNGKQYNKKRVYRIMKAAGIQSVIRRKRKTYPKPDPSASVENVLARDFVAERPNEKWATDVTEFKWYDGREPRKLYLSAIIDLYDRSIVAWDISARNDNMLVFRTFNKAVEKYPDAKPVFHSDRGFQYTSLAFHDMLLKQEMQQSLSRVGHCIDNGPTEGFWGIVKSEMFYLRKFTDAESLRTAIEAYIEFYNTSRPQERFGFQTPDEVRKAALSTADDELPAQYPIALNRRIEEYKARYAA